jgi:hypothetical protein
MGRTAPAKETTD